MIQKVLKTLFGDTAEILFDNDYEPVPLAIGAKRPIIKDWTNQELNNLNVIEKLVAKYPASGIGLRCGSLIAVDSDVNDPAASYAIRELAIKHFGATPLIRYGNRPKKALLFKRKGPSFSKKTTPVLNLHNEKAQVEVLANGNQIVAYNIHPVTGQPYEWEDESPLDVPLENLPAVSETQIEAFLLEVEQLLISAFAATKLKSSGGSPIPINALCQKPQKFDIAMTKSALSVLDPQDRETWIAIGHALKSIGEEAAFKLFITWSQKRPDGSRPHNFVSEADVKKVWDGMKPERTGHRAIYSRAASKGWEAGSCRLFSRSHTAVAKHLLELSKLFGPGLIFDEGNLWQYNGSHWEKMRSSEQRKLVHELDGRPVGNKTIAANASFVSGVLSELYAEAECHGFFSAAPTGINAKNGFVQINDKGGVEFHPHDPAFAQGSTLDINWTGEAAKKPTGLLERYLDSTFGSLKEGKQQLALQILGVAAAGISTNLVDPKAFVLFGPSASNGKSQFLELIRGFVPSEVVSNVPPADFSKEQHVAELAGKTANLCDELEISKSLRSDRFKALVTGDPVTAKVIYQRPFSFSPKAIHVFATNHLPNFNGGADPGVKRRLVSINFDRPIPVQQRIPQIAKKILKWHGEELLSLAISAVSDVISNGGYLVPDSVLKDTETWFLEADLVLTWIQEGGLERNVSSHGISTQVLYSFFKVETAEVSDPGYQIGYRGFTARLRQALVGDTAYQMKRSNKGQMVYRREFF